ncbi:MAG: hypothetical protein WCJ58_05570 [bacterium]
MRKLLKIAGVLGASGAAYALALVNAAAQVDYTYTTSSSGDPAVAWAVILFYCCCLAIVLALMIGSTLWTYKDAKKNNVENPILWPILVFFGWFVIPVIGGFGVILIYVLAIRNKKKA